MQFGWYSHLMHISRVQPNFIAFYGLTNHRRCLNLDDLSETVVHLMLTPSVLPDPYTTVVVGNAFRNTISW
ncbi:15339_t:CDS:2 [Funneliformis mosseae]|uniref:15339_t:CDS:1 n=1 Tax=Funneliformis mosseae TaxID=27381 RepID=A0A9N9B8Q3_FUNMO|nr:15339_t:CDS:2 [Funneliformis mosseae]